MKNGSARFEFYLAQLQTLLDKAARQKNPGLWLYQNNARTPLFMLEGLAKIYSALHNKKKFAKIKTHFKLLEDVLGTIDYYDGFAKIFTGNKKIPAEVINYLQAQSREKIQSLNELLTEEKWIGNSESRIKKIRQKLNKADWLKEVGEIKAIDNFYGQSIYGIVEFIHKNKLQFTNVESDVHELRRKLRWLSIYPQALQGCVQLSNSKTASKHLNKYLTEEIVNSPFNKLPDAGNCRQFLLLNKNYFYSLSWMIAALGKIKDSGLGVIVVKEALQQTDHISENEAYTKAYTMLGIQQPQLPQLLKNAENICTTFFAENNLEHLVMATAAAK
jgi:hypothetical protein